MPGNKTFAIGNVLITGGLAVTALCYGTDWGQQHLAMVVVLLVVTLLMAVSVLLAIGSLSNQPGDSAVNAIAENLRDLVDVEGTEEVLEKISAVPVASKTTDAGRGWNRLVDVFDRMHQQIQDTQAQNVMGQFLCSYDSQKLLALIDFLPDGIILADATGSVILANRSCNGKIARSFGELIEKPIDELFDDEHARENLQRLVAHKSVQCQSRFDVTLGEEPDITDLRIYCQRLVHGNAENSEILLVIRDITQQKISDAGRNDFIAHVSHELRSPLTNIRAYAETLLSDMVLDATSQKEAFNVINNETIRLTRLINDVLDLSRMESGSLSLERGQVVLDRLIRQCVNDVKAAAVEKKITLQTNYHPKLPNIYADREKLAVVVNNIISNAIKYTPEGGNVFVETNADDDFVYIKVADTGYGIATEDVDRVFDKFYRVQREETAKIAGTGLGLAACKEIVSLHDGTINISSELNNGTELMIKLPLTQTDPVLGPSSGD